MIKVDPSGVDLDGDLDHLFLYWFDCLESWEIFFKKVGCLLSEVVLHFWDVKKWKSWDFLGSQTRLIILFSKIKETVYEIVETSLEWIYLFLFYFNSSMEQIFDVID